MSAFYYWYAPCNIDSELERAIKDKQNKNRRK